MVAAGEARRHAGLGAGDRRPDRVIFEGRDAAGKGSTIKRVSEYLNPRVTRIVALPAPDRARARRSWYFQRYVPHLPAARRDRADGPLLVQPRRRRARDGLLHQRRVPPLPAPGADLRADAGRGRHHPAEVLVQRVGRGAGAALPLDRADDPMRRWKLCPNDVLSITKWEDYSRAKDTMFVHTDIPEAPWCEVDDDDKRRSRINMIAHLLSQVPYEMVEREEVIVPPRPPSGGYERPPRDMTTHVPDYSEEVEQRHKEERVDSSKSKRKREKDAAKIADREEAKDDN